MYAYHCHITTKIDPHTGECTYRVKYQGELVAADRCEDTLTAEAEAENEARLFFLGLPRAKKQQTKKGQKAHAIHL